MAVKAPKAHEVVGVDEAPACAPLMGDLCWLLSQASHTLTTELTAGLESLGISPRARCVLATADTGAYTQVELARMVGLDKTTMVVTVDELEAAGLARRGISPSDRRVRVVEVTPAGRRMTKEADAVFARISESVLETLPRRDREQFMASLTTLVSERLREPAVCKATVRRHS